MRSEREAIFGMGLVVSRLAGADADKAALADVLRMLAAMPTGDRSLHERDKTRPEGEGGRAPVALDTWIA